MQTQPLVSGQLAEFHAMLVEQRTFRVEQLAQLQSPEDGGPLSCPIPDVFDELAAGARAALADVLAALRRMDDGTYGACTSCGATVQPQRLEILPQAALCMGCQRRHPG